MSVSKEMLQTWLHNDIADKPLLLHGTSMQGIEILLEHDLLLRGKTGKIYFVPVYPYFQQSEHAIKLGEKQYAKKDAIETAKFYAEYDARLYFIKQELGHIPDWYENAIHERDILQLCMTDDERINIDENQINILLDRFFQQKGVLIEPKETIFELSCQKGDEGCVKFHAEIPAEHIRGIRPLGDIERRILHVS